MKFLSCVKDGAVCFISKENYNGCLHSAVTGTSNGYSRSPDDDVFVHLAKTYSFNHASMYKGTGCDSRQTFPDGITNGYSWYQLEGKNVHAAFSATSDSFLLLPPDDKGNDCKD